METSHRTAVACTAALLLFALFPVATVGQATENRTNSDVEAAVLGRLGEIEDAARSLDPEAVFSFVSDNDHGALIQNGIFYLTREDALEATRAGFEGLKKIEYKFDHQYVVSLSPTVALATGEGSTTATTGDGNVFTARFAQSVILQLIEGEWKVLHAHRSFPPGR